MAVKAQRQDLIVFQWMNITVDGMRYLGRSFNVNTKYGGMTVMSISVLTVVLGTSEGHMNKANWPFPPFPNPLDKPGKAKFNPDNLDDALL